MLLAAFAYAQAANEVKGARGPAGLVVSGGMEKIQAALEHEGLLHGAKPGELDDATAAALRQFQGAHCLARTGVPDHQTVRILGLAPDDIFKLPQR
jgi:hypothetical protein